MKKMERYNLSAIMNKILLIDDDKSVYDTLCVLIYRMGCHAEWKSTLFDGLQAVSQGNYDVVLLDVQLPDGCGLDIVSKIQQAPSSPEVIIMTGFGELDGAEMAFNNGAWDYIQKTGSPQRIMLSLKRVLEYRKEKTQSRQTPVALNLEGLIGESRSLKACYDQLANAATGDANVLISGETGTGKEIFARAIHENSRRSHKSLVIVDCAALPETLVESLLFGHEKGVYTGADKARDGLISQADGGTLFLDEVGEMPLTIQKVFLRVLQERKYRPVGGRTECSSNFRLIAATNCDLDQMVARGEFRNDMLYRLRTINITLPPLRKRDNDAILLTTHYLPKICERLGIDNKGFSPCFTDNLKQYSWPGNIRELINVLETAISNAGPEPTLYSRHLPPNIRLSSIREVLKRTINAETWKETESSKNEISDSQLSTFKVFRKKASLKAEKKYLQMLLDDTQHNLEKALEISGLSRSRFYELLKHHELSL
ncbi:sigma-54-dependent transcriptional regulator [Desulfosarcina ovata]|uniref:Fis family transcriptional regulator n=1 Tax=Desulfosarcina ovata subsp. ovata TaxID=2752305 RepID=A0A5K8AAR5_9BACT|nr:sigma-54 dependent transcriptional regulator [Desulfosarcina ovata]BBO89040.1 Fis family transcriptional regulator [Desulfosarcina ovata subsp. ovata]